MSALSENIPEFIKSDIQKSIISNLRGFDENFENLEKYLSNLDTIISSILSQQIIEEIKEYVVDNIQKFKKRVEYQYSQTIGFDVNIDGYIYQLVDSRTVKISRDGFPTWNTKDLIIQVQETSTGKVLYPIIEKNIGYFTLIFSDDIDTDGTVIFI